MTTEITKEIINDSNDNYMGPYWNLGADLAMAYAPASQNTNYQEINPSFVKAQQEIIKQQQIDFMYENYGLKDLSDKQRMEFMEKKVK